MKILCINDHVRSSINDSHERIRVITNTSFSGRPFELNKMMNNQQFSVNHTSCVFYFESIIKYRNTLRAGCLSEKAYDIHIRKF